MKTEATNFIVIMIATNPHTLVKYGEERVNPNVSSITPRMNPRSLLIPLTFQMCLEWDEQHHFEDGQAEGLRALMHTLAEKLPLSDRTIYNRFSLLHLPESLQTKIEQRQKTIKTAEALTHLKNLWEIKVKNLTDEEIEKKRPEIKSRDPRNNGIHR